MNTYKGSCHCGNVQYEVKVDLTKPVMTCNCSICSRKGTMLTFVPTEQFTLVKGEGAQTDYLFNKKHIHHLFCKTCGVASFANGVGPDGKAMVAINARCLEGVDLAALPVKQFDGKSM